MKPEELAVYMRNAYSFAALSKAQRKKVGAVLVTNQGIVIPGVNGTVAGSDNCCEYTDPDTGELLTKPTTLHAELNCILKAARQGVSCIDATLFVTLSPCEPCSAMIAQAGITQVYYSEDYRIRSGIDFLKSNGVSVQQLLVPD
jgi:dCMP deaminase